MKKIIQLVAILISSFALNAQNLLSEDASGFEGEESGWQIQNKNVFEFSNKKQNSGAYSLKVFKTSYNAKGKNAVAIYENAFPRGLKSGKYKVSAKVLVSRNAPKGFGFKLKGEEFKNIYLSFEGVPTHKWISVSKTVEIKRMKVTDAIIIVSKNPKYGGNGLFYVDDIVFEKI